LRLTIPVSLPSRRIFQPSAVSLDIQRRANGRYVIRSPDPNDSPLGVDTSIHQAIGTAVREATALSRVSRRPVSIMVEQDSGRFKLEQIVKPPVKVGKKVKAIRSERA
jgi:hypothetical protein